MHPLDGAYARLARAEEHLQELESINDGLVSELCNVGVEVLDKEIKQFPEATRTGSELIKFAFDQTATPPTLRIQVLVGETIYNLRAALDYFVYQLAILNSGRVQHYTQFPIERTPSKFRKGAIRTSRESTTLMLKLSRNCSIIAESNGWTGSKRYPIQISIAI